METNLVGVLPVLATPFNADETIDFDTLKQEIEWVLDRGVNGVVLAMVSEFLRLDIQERVKTAKFICDVAGPRGAVVISVGAESTFHAEKLARHAEDCGADALMAIPPVSVSLSESDLLEYFHRLLEAVTIPVIVQDASGYVGRPMSIELQAKLLRHFGDRVMYKPEANPIGPRLSALRDATNGKARVFEGTGGLMLVDSYRRGIVGTMPAVETADFVVALWKALENGDEESIYQISQPLASLVAMETSLDAFIAISKHLLMKRGVFRNNVVRRPTGYKLDPETQQEIERLFARLTNAVNTTQRRTKPPVAVTVNVTAGRAASQPL